MGKIAALFGFLAFVVVLLIFFGYIKVERFVRDDCSMIDGIGCRAKVSITAVELVVKNDLPYAMQDFEVYVEKCDNAGKAKNGLARNEEEKLTIACDNEAGTFFESGIVIRYKERKAYAQQEFTVKEGMIATKVLL